MQELNGAALVSVGKTSLRPCLPNDLDSRGIVWVWEQPRDNARYVLGIDTAVGITGWDRLLRTDEDAKIDNAVVQVIRCGTPDVQVCEFAAPIDHYELATVVNFLGRMYAGNAEDGQALVAIEMNNGGWATHNELVNRYGYIAMPPWRMSGQGLTERITDRYGWYSNRSTRKDLWIKGMRLINGRAIVPHSPWLIEEMTDCTWDNFLAMTARGIYGSHDDRVVSLLIALWYAHEWDVDFNPPEQEGVEQAALPDYQRTAMSLDQMHSDWDDRFSNLLGDD